MFNLNLKNNFEKGGKITRDTVLALLALLATEGVVKAGETEGVLRAKNHNEVSEGHSALPAANRLVNMEGDSITVPLNGGKTFENTPNGHTLTTMEGQDVLVYTDIDKDGMVDKYKRTGKVEADFDFTKDKEFKTVGSVYYEAANRIQQKYHDELATMVKIQENKQAKFFASASNNPDSE